MRRTSRCPRRCQSLASSLPRSSRLPSPIQRPRAPMSSPTAATRAPSCLLLCIGMHFCCRVTTYRAALKTTFDHESTCSPLNQRVTRLHGCRCDQHKAWGNCDTVWMKQGGTEGLCNRTCGVCTPGAASTCIDKEVGTGTTCADYKSYGALPCNPFVIACTRSKVFAKAHLAER